MMLCSQCMVHIALGSSGEDRQYAIQIPAVTIHDGRALCSVHWELSYFGDSSFKRQEALSKAGVQ